MDALTRNLSYPDCIINGVDLKLSGLMHSDATNTEVKAAAGENRKYTYTLCDECGVYSVVAVAPPA